MLGHFGVRVIDKGLAGIGACKLNFIHLALIFNKQIISLERNLPTLIDAYQNKYPRIDVVLLVIYIEQHEGARVIYSFHLVLSSFFNFSFRWYKSKKRQMCVSHNKFRDANPYDEIQLTNDYTTTELSTQHENYTLLYIYTHIYICY